MEKQRSLESTISAVLVALALGITGARWLLSGDERVALFGESVIGSIGYFVALAAPALVLVVPHGSASARKAAAAVGAPISLVVGSVLGVVSAVLYVVLLFRRIGEDESLRIATVALVGGALVLAAYAIFARQDPRSWTTATGGGGTSDVITAAESLAAAAALVVALVAARSDGRRRGLSP